MAKILVTGACGYLGQHVVNSILSNCDYEVIAVDIKKGNTDHPRLTNLEMDFLSQAKDETLIDKLGRPDVVIHLAWQDGFNHKSDKHLLNLNNHFEFLKNMINSGCKSISAMGTMHEIGYFEGAIKGDTPCNPLNLYGVAKNALRQAMMVFLQDKSDVSFKWLRAYYITGDDKRNNSIFAKILQMAEEGKKSFPFTSGENKYDFLDVNLLADQIVKASIQTQINGAINCCSGNPVSLKDKVEQFIKEKNLDIAPEYGVYPSRRYDSPAIWGDATLINKIMNS